jgi:tetratricopeptide (TPR) repeat protein
MTRKPTSDAFEPGREANGALADDAPSWRYRAFLSYSHRDHRQVAWLHRTLESYRVPRKLVGRASADGAVPARIRPIFRDREELSASADLGTAIQAALRESRYLVVICSPASAASRWVNEEVLEFKRLRGERRILAVIASGEPGGGEQECFPPALRFRLGADGQLSDVPAEPIAADLRPQGDGRRLATLKLVAGLLALDLDDLVQRESQRRVRQFAMLAAASLAGMGVAGGLAFYANARRIEADQQRAIAERESATARAASDYLIGTFALSNPATENPKTITAFSILARSGERARAELRDQPVVQARLMSTIGQAYVNLGLLDQARGLIEPMLPTLRRVGPEGADAALTLAMAYFKQGQLDRATQEIGEARRLMGAASPQNLEGRARAFHLEGMIATADGKTSAALAAYDSSLALYRALPRPPERRISGVLRSRANLLSDDRQFAAAETSLAEALDIDRRTLGEQHLVTAQTWFLMAQNEFLAGDFKSAESRIGKALAIEERVLDGDNPILGDTLSMQGQILQGEHRLPEAERCLDRAIAIYRAAFKGPHYLIGIAEIYVALVQSDRGQTEAALRTLDDAKHNYDVSYGRLHANHGDLLVNRATILAHAGRRAEARRDCAAGLDILGRTLGPQASYTRSMAEVCAKLS